MSATVYSTLIDEALEDSFQQREWNGELRSDLERQIELFVGAENRLRLMQLIKGIAGRTYLSGLNHGYQQAAQAFDERRGDPQSAPVDNSARVDCTGFGEHHDFRQVLAPGRAEVRLFCSRCGTVRVL